MRLTLRTMLAYLDKVLDPQDAADLGKKIEESQFATDLMHRIQDVLRRLRLAAPKVEGKGIGLDANSVAEYLDNTMPAERVADLERVCLESDIHLAEVAACHQILDLVLREPVEVEDRLKARAYALPKHAAELAAQAQVKSAHHDTPAPQAPSRTPPPLESSTAKGNTTTSASTSASTVTPPALDKSQAKAPIDLAAAVSASVHESSATHTTGAGSESGLKQRKVEVPEYLKSPPKKKRGSPVLALVSIITVFAALGVFLFKTPQGEALLSQLVPSKEKVAETTPGKGELGPAVKQPETTPAQPAPADPNALPEAPLPPGTQPVSNTPAPAMPAAPGTPAAPVTAPATTLPVTPTVPAPGTPVVPVAPLPPGTAPLPVTPLPATPVPGTPLPVTPGAPAVGTPAVPAPATTTTPPAAMPATNFTPVLPGQPAPTQPVTVTPPVPVVPPTPAPAPATSPAVEAAPIVAMGTLTSTDSLTAAASTTGTNVWKRLTAKSQVSSSDRILSLPGYRSSLTLAYGLSVQLLGGTQVELVAPDGRGVPGLVLAYGRILISPDGKADAELRLGGGSKQGQIQFVTGDTVLALEIRPIRVDGEDPTINQAPLVIDLYVNNGEIKWTDPTTGMVTPVKAPARYSLGVPPVADSPEAQSIPLWLTSDDRNEKEKLAAPVLLQEAGADRAISLALKEQADHRREEVRLLAVRGLMYLDECEAIVTALRDESQSRNWDAQIDALREACALSPSSAQRVKKAFESHRGPAKGGELFRMLGGYTADQLKNGAAASLVKSLDHEDLDFRVLSFFNLRRIAPKAASTYRPNSPASVRRPHVTQWELRLERGDLVPKG